MAWAFGEFCQLTKSSLIAENEPIRDFTNADSLSSSTLDKSTFNYIPIKAFWIDNSISSLSPFIVTKI
jgi:hypothetical protein